MKNFKLFLSICIFSIISTFKSYAIPPGQWFNELVGYTCVAQVTGVVQSNQWPSNGPEGLCYKTYVIVCHSWLWGTKTSDEFNCWGSCQGAGGLVNPPNPTPGLGTVYDAIAAFYTVQHNNNIQGINSEWMNANSLQNQETLNDAVVFRLRLAGYNADNSWISAEGACNFNNPPTLPVQVPLEETPNVECN